MAVTAATFIARFPEFGNLDSDVVAASLKEAERQCDADAWGNTHDEAIHYLTAHMLALRTQAIGQQVGAIPSGSLPEGFRATNYGYVYELMLQALPTTTGFVF